LFGLGVVLLAHRLGALLLPEQPAVALGTMAFVAFNPTLLHSAASVNNDAAAAFFGAWAMVEAVSVAQNRAGQWTAVRFALALGLGLVTKVSVGVLAPVALLAWWQPMRRDWRRVAREFGLIALILLALTGWWFLRNYLASGDMMG